jgi:hypothetical protein
MLLVAGGHIDRGDAGPASEMATVGARVMSPTSTSSLAAPEGPMPRRSSSPVPVIVLIGGCSIHPKRCRITNRQKHVRIRSDWSTADTARTGNLSCICADEPASQTMGSGSGRGCYSSGSHVLPDRQMVRTGIPDDTRAISQ